ncbi:MAG: hypothetical protein R3E67_00135 [Pseudomonadales bacterium]
MLSILMPSRCCVLPIFSVSHCSPQRRTLIRRPQITPNAGSITAVALPHMQESVLTGTYRKWMPAIFFSGKNNDSAAELQATLHALRSQQRR